MLRTPESNHHCAEFVAAWESVTKTKSRRLSVLVIAVLSFLALGLLSISLIPQNAHSASSTSSKLALKTDKDPALVNLADFKNGYATVIDPALRVSRHGHPFCWHHPGSDDLRPHDF